MNALSADRFIDSIGVNVHMTYPGPYMYGGFGRVGRVLNQLGISHVRDGQDANQLWQPSVIAMLFYAYGVRSTLAYDPRSVGTLDERFSILRPSVGPDMLDALEGPNEYNTVAPFVDYPAPTPQWAYDLASWMQQLRAARDAWYPSVPLIGPSLTNWQAYQHAHDAGVAQYEDFANVHPYPGGNHPSRQDGGVDWHLQECVARLHDGPYPTQVTEINYQNAYLQPYGHVGVDLATGAAYIVPLLLEYYRRGVERTFIYELFDQGYDWSRDSQESDFGLVYWSYEGAPQLKPSGVVISNTIAALRSTGNADQTAPLDYEITDNYVDSILLRRADGKWALVLWDPRSRWDVANRKTVAPIPSGIPVHVNFPENRTVEWVEPARGSQVFYHVLDRTAYVAVSADGPTILLIS